MECVTRRSKVRASFTRWAGGNSLRPKFRRLGRKKLPILFVLLALLISFGMPSVAKAQAAGGSITGAVRGESGAAMPGVHVAVTDVASGAARTALTDTNGFYNVPDLPPATYEMSVTFTGFVTQVLTAINVASGAERVFNVVMRAGNP